MNAPGETTPAVAAHIALGSIGGIAKIRTAVYLACLLSAVVTNVVLGKDMAWDTLNYHLYAGFSALHDRFSQDYFAAGEQSYLNPYAYVPFYMMVHWGLSALLISTVLAAVHSVFLWLTFELGTLVSPSSNDYVRAMVGIGAATLAFVNPIFLQEVGSTFADITTGELVLAGWLLLARAMNRPANATVYSAGLLLGFASALKLTNAVHAVSAAMLLACLPMGFGDKARYAFRYFVGLVAGFLLAGGAWSSHLLRLFGNPLFPLMNGLFRSPYFTTSPLIIYRFIPATLEQFLFRPFAIVRMGRMVDTEPSSPDLRYAALVVLVFMALIAWVWRRKHPRPPAIAQPQAIVANRVFGALGLGFAIDWVLWQLVSGNGRYFLAAASIAAVLIAGLLWRLYDSKTRLICCFLLGLLAAQGIQLSDATDFRWNKVPWGGPWLRAEVPEKLRAKPYLYLTIGVQSNSFIAPFLARRSGLVNFSGGYALAPGDANGARVESLIRRYSPNVRMLVLGRRLYTQAEKHEPTADYVNTALERFGLRVDPSDCQTFTLIGLPTVFEVPFDGAAPMEAAPRNTSYLLSCRVIADEAAHQAQLKPMAVADTVFDHLEHACPILFQPSGLRTEHVVNSWRRLYENTDISAWISDGRVRFQAIVGDGSVIDLGRESDWVLSSMPLECGRLPGGYFARRP